MSFRKETILIDATGGTQWIGGLYYKKNVVFSFLQNEYITNNYRIIVVSEKENLDIFKSLSPSLQLIPHNGASGRARQIKLLMIALKTHTKYIFPANGNILKCLKLIGVKLIRWIPDFQHNRLPELFSLDVRNQRNRSFMHIAREDQPLILSSYDSLNDLNRFYITDKSNVYVMHFVSYISDILRCDQDLNERAILEKYGLTNCRYICIMNQFWQHKNHIVILQAMKVFFSHNPNSDYIFVFTGKLVDNRAPQYIEKLKALFEEPAIKEHSAILGFIEREEQIVIMKNAEYIIQPSLFEGWGTVVEDAKVLDKTILLSDIPVHREQMNDKGILFEPHDSTELSKLIEIECKKEHKDDVDKGIADMYERAKEYSKSFEQLLKDLKGNSI